MKSLLDPTFKYKNSVETDIRKTFAEARRRIAKAKKVAEEQKAKVMPIKKSVV